MDILKTIPYNPINVITASNDTQAMRNQINMTDLDKKPSLRASENENKIITEAKENKELLTKIDMTIERKTKRQLTTTAINDVINKIKERYDKLAISEKKVDALLNTNSEHFFESYKKLKLEIDFTKTEFRKIFTTNKIDHIGEKLTKHIIEVNSQINMIKNDLKIKKKEFYIKASSHSSHSLSKFPLVINPAITHIEDIQSNWIYCLMTPDEFNSFKTIRCKNEECSDKFLMQDGNENSQIRYTTCTFYHSSMDKRRNPCSKNNEPILFYNSKFICKDCIDRDDHDIGCFYCKNYFEFYYHPDNYKSKICPYNQCTSIFCPFYHCDEEKIQWETCIFQVTEVTKKYAKIRNLINNNSKKFQPSGFFGYPMHKTKSIESQNNFLIFPSNKLDVSFQMKQDQFENKEIGYYIKYKPWKNDNLQYHVAEERFIMVDGGIFDAFNFHKLVKIICGLLNTKGGNLLIGVDDVTHCVVGLEITEKDFEMFKNKIMNVLNDNFNPKVPKELITITKISVILTENNHKNVIMKDINHVIVKIEIKSQNVSIFEMKSNQINDWLYLAYSNLNGKTKRIKH